MSILFRNITRPQHQPDDVEKIHFLSLGVWHSWSLGLAANRYAPPGNTWNLSDETGQTTFHRYSALEEKSPYRASKRRYFVTIGDGHSWMIRLTAQLEMNIISKLTTQASLIKSRTICRVDTIHPTLIADDSSYAGSRAVIFRCFLAGSEPDANLRIFGTQTRKTLESAYQRPHIVPLSEFQRDANCPTV